MPRKAKPYVKDGWYCTSIGGVQHQKRCRVEDGQHVADIALARLIVAREDAKRAEAVYPTPGPGVQLLIKPEALRLPSTPTHGVIDEFLDAKKVETAGSTYIGYRDCLMHFRERFGAGPIASITYAQGIKFKDWLRKECVFVRGKQRRVGLAPARVNKIIRVAKILFNWAAKPSRRARYGLQTNPWEEIKFYVEKPRERLITAEEFRHFIEQCTDGNVRGGKADFREQLTVLRYTTMRPGELRKLRWDYVQFDLNRIVFPADVVKTRRRREVVMIETVKTVLQNRAARARDKGLQLSGYVFPLPIKDQAGKRAAVEAGDRPQKSDGFSQRFRRLFERCVRLGLVSKEAAGERLVAYSTRHTRITELFMEGNEHHVVMFDAGHVVPATTERYKHLASRWVAEQIRARDKNE